MFVCIVSLSHPTCREWYLLYVKYLCVLSRYLGPVVENGICYMLNVCMYCLVILVCVYCPLVVERMLNISLYVVSVICLCVLTRYLGPVVENDICYMLNVCVYCLVFSAQ